jgi:hypothetical protein
VPGFGSGVFGYGPFGRHDWAKHVLFRDLPEIDRQLDAEQSGGRLEKFVDSIKPSFDFLLGKTIDFGDLRDPDTVRTQFSENISVTILSAVPVGRVIEVTVFDPDTADPFNPLADCGLGWILEDASGRQYKVNAVHKLRPNVVEVTGVVELPTIGAATLRPPSLIELLGADYGIEVDFHEPDAFQRSSVKNAVQWLDLKGSEKSYDILGKIAGYRVTPIPLWSIEAVFDAIPADHVYEIPFGSGLFYTDIAPTRPFLDEVAADVVPLDVMCWEVSDTGAPMPNTGTWDAPPPIGGVPSGTTLEEAIGWTMNATPILSTTNLGLGRWRIEVGPAADLTPIAGIGQWYAAPVGMPGSKFYLETLPVETAPGVWEFEVLAGTAPTFGATVDLEYECRMVIDCGFCRASAIRVEVVPVEVLTDPDALLDGVLTRLVRKILQVVPIHVRITDIVHIVGPTQIPLNLSITVSFSPSVLAYGPLGYYYDTVPADELPIDPDHMIVSGTVFTIP